MIITERKILFIDTEHNPKIRVIRQNWVADDYDRLSEKTSWYARQSIPPIADSGYNIMIEISKESDALDEPIWKAVELKKMT